MSGEKQSQTAVVAVAEPVSWHSLSVVTISVITSLYHRSMGMVVREGGATGNTWCAGMGDPVHM